MARRYRRRRSVSLGRRIIRLLFGRMTLIAFLPVASFVIASLLPEERIPERARSVIAATKDIAAQAGGAILPGAQGGMPQSFEESKKLLAARIYHDQREDRYCGCRYDSRLNVDLDSCPMKTELFADRQSRIEIEHIVPASDFGRQRPCWRSPPPGEDGRKHCGRVDETYRQMEADPHNLIPVIGALNAIRLNHRFGMVAQGHEEPVVSGCGFRVARDGGGRFIEPPDAMKGKIARTYMFFEWRYGHRIGGSQRRLFAAWDRQYPPEGFELERNRRLFAATGVANPFVENLGGVGIAEHR